MSYFTNITSLFGVKKGGKSHIKNLLEVAAADGKFLEVEESLLFAIAKRNNITKNQIAEIRKSSPQVEFTMPKDDREKFLHLYELVHMMLIDKHIHEEEFRLCEAFAVKFGYRSDAAKEIINAIKSNIENENGPDETMKRISFFIKE